MTGQFGKNHLGDRNEMLPTNHGFDEFFGNLYHLNAEEEPENPDYPKNPEFKKRFGPRGVSLLRYRRHHRGPAFGKWASRNRRHRPAHHEAHGDGGRRGHPRRVDFMERRQGRQAVLRLVELHPHARLHAPKAGVGRQDRPRRLSRRHGRARRHGWPIAREAQ